MLFRSQTVLNEVKESSNFNAFLIAGGPHAVGTGGFHIFRWVFYLGLHVQYLLSDRVQTGQTICNGQTFEEYLGPLLKAVHDKYCEWLGTAYSKCTSSHIGLF